MILTCPACETKYVVKDGAIPPGGRQVRCAACKHAWHQHPEPSESDGAMAADPGTAAVESLGGPPLQAAEIDQEQDSANIGEVPATVGREAMISDGSESLAGDLPAASGTASFASPVAEPNPNPLDGPTAPSFAPSLTAEEPAAVPATDGEAWDGDAQFISAIDDDEERSGRGFKTALLLLAVIALVAAGLWVFAPPSFKERIGLADARATPLEVMLTTSDRQKLASGNELLAISGRVINPTDQEQAVPQIRASLRNRATRKLVYQWTIAPPARFLPPRGSASFNSAEVDIPQGGDELTVTLDGAAG